MASIGSPRALVTPGSVSNLQSYLADPANVSELYAALTDRERLVGRLLDETNSQRGLGPLDKIDRLIRIRDAAPILEDIPDYALRECFKRAVKSHDYRQPFQLCEVAAAWISLGAADKDTLTRSALPPGPVCEWCNGTGLMRARTLGCHWPRRAWSPYILEPVTWNWHGETNTMLRCRCRMQHDL
jgi:hypothetical protein